MTNARTDSSAKYIGLATVIAGCVILALAAGLRQTSGVFLQPVTMDLNLSRQSFGVGVQNLVWGLSQPLAGYLADRYGARPVALVCGLMYSAGLALTSTAAGGLWLAATLGVLVGLGQAGTGGDTCRSWQGGRDRTQEFSTRPRVRGSAPSCRKRVATSGSTSQVTSS